MTLGSTASRLRIDAAGVFAAAAITAVAGAIIVVPMLASDRTSVATRRAELDTLKAESQAQTKALDYAEKEVARLTEQAREGVSLISSRKVADRMVEIAAVAKESGAKIAQTEPAQKLEKTEKPSVVKVPIKIVGTATYPEVTRFVHELHDRFRDTALTGLSLQATPADKSPSAQFTIDLAWYADAADSAGKPATP